MRRKNLDFKVCDDPKQVLIRGVYITPTKVVYLILMYLNKG